MNDIVITSLRGGLNNSDAPTTLPDDQCAVATNVEWISSALGERRNGTEALTLPSVLTAFNNIPWIYNHTPASGDVTEAELWALGCNAVTGSANPGWARKTSSWATVTPSPDNLVATLGTHITKQNQVHAASLNGKVHLAMYTGVERFHVGEGTSIRRSGIAYPSSFTSAMSAADNTGIAANAFTGGLTGKRYYRERIVVMSGSTVLRRSEPTTAIEFTPSGSYGSITITLSVFTDVEGATHREVEASVDGVNYYRITRVTIGTLTVQDTETYAANAYTSYTLSESVGDYTPLPDARFVIADDDRILTLGSYTSGSTYEQAVCWTPVRSADGVGNDERMELDTDPYVVLDTGGKFTGVARLSTGVIGVFKDNRIFRLVRTGQRNKAYEARVESETIGAVRGSIVTAIDERGETAIYFIDSNVGPCRWDSSGIYPCGEDIRTSWSTINPDATIVPAVSWYYPTNRQVCWAIAVGANNEPSTCIVLHTRFMRRAEGGYRGGWATWTNDPANPIAACTFASNVESNTTRSRKLRPIVAKPTTGGAGTARILDKSSATTDSGVDGNQFFTSRITTKAFSVGRWINEFGLMMGVVSAKSASGVSLSAQLIRDHGLETGVSNAISLTPTFSEDHVIRTLDALSMSEMQTVQIQFGDSGSPGGKWALTEFVGRIRKEQER